MTTQTPPADLLAPLLALVDKWRDEDVNDGIRDRFRTATACADELQASIDSLAANRGEVAWWVGYSDGHTGRAPFHCIGPDKPNPALWRQSIRWTPLYFHPPQAQAGAGDAWLPIETCPRDGRRLILLLTPSRHPQVAYSNTWWTAGFSVECKPTHWAPIPPLDTAALEAKP